MKKVAILVHASENETGKAVHALLYAQELHAAGHKVKVLFDGAGTVWVKQFEDPSNQFNPLYKAVKETGVITGACEYCSEAFGVAEEVKRSGVAFVSETGGHPSFEKLIAEDYQVVTL